MARELFSPQWPQLRLDLFLSIAQAENGQKMLFRRVYKTRDDSMSYTFVKQTAMFEGKVTVSFRVSPRFKYLLEEAAARERPPLCKHAEILLFVYCEEHGG